VACRLRRRSGTGGARDHRNRSARSGQVNGIIVTASGLVFGAGRDNQIRAWDSDTGRQLWSSRFGGDFVGSPVMYEMAGRQYLLVPAASTPPRGGGPGPEAPRGWVAYALPRP
jgi:glucose dehydrogenase